MSRNIKKKVIDDSLKFSDDFDESMLDRMESELDGPGEIESQEGRKRSRERTPSDRGTADADFRKTAPQSPPADETPQFRIPEEPGERPSNHVDDAEPKKTPLHRRIAAKRMLAIGFAIALLVILPAVAWVRLQSQRHQTPIVQYIRHPVPVPHHQLETKFMLLAGSETKKDIIEMGVQFDFLTTNSFEKFKDAQTLMQDKCYQFMKNHNPGDGSQKNWTKLVQNDLLRHLQNEFPKLHIETITLTEFVRL